MSKTRVDLALAQAEQIRTADQPCALVAAQRQLDGGVAAGGVRMDLDGEQVVAATEDARGAR